MRQVGDTVYQWGGHKVCRVVRQELEPVSGVSLKL